MHNLFNNIRHFASTLFSSTPKADPITFSQVAKTMNEGFSQEVMNTIKNISFASIKKPMAIKQMIKIVNSTTESINEKSLIKVPYKLIEDNIVPVLRIKELIGDSIWVDDKNIKSLPEFFSTCWHTLATGKKIHVKTIFNVAPENTPLVEKFLVTEMTGVVDQQFEVD